MLLSKRPTVSLSLAALLVLTAVSIGGARQARAGGNTATRVVQTGQAAPAPVQVTATRMLVTAEGKTLYLFAPDKPNQSNCIGDCAKFWPPLLLPAGMKIPAVPSNAAGTFGVAARADGTRQLTYDGAPLYTFIKDTKPGDMTGQGVEGVWWVAVGNVIPEAQPVVATAPAQLLTTADGKTLYLFTPDKVNKSNCNGPCAKFWPPLILPSGATAATTVPGMSGTFAAAVRTGGAQQLTYDGAPLYTFIKDTKPGDMTGQGVEGVWWAVVGSPTVASSPAAPAVTTGGSDASGLTWDTASKTANLTLETSHDNTLSGLNFNGYANGGMTISIPVGYRVTVTLRNKGSFPHSAVITAYANRNNTAVFEPAFPGASSPAPTQGTPAGAEQQFSFVPNAPGTYALVCGVRQHARVGMWDTFVVTNSGAPSITPMT